MVTTLKVGGWCVKKFYSDKILHILKLSLRYWDSILCLPSFKTFFIDHISLIFIISYFSTFSYSIEDACSLASISHLSCHAIAPSLHLKLNVSMWLILGNETWAREACVTSRLTLKKKNHVHFTTLFPRLRVEWNSTSWWLSMDRWQTREKTFIFSLPHKLKILTDELEQKKTANNINIPDTISLLILTSPSHL